MWYVKKKQRKNKKKKEKYDLEFKWNEMIISTKENLIQTKLKKFLNWFQKTKKTLNNVNEI